MMTLSFGNAGGIHSTITDFMTDAFTADERAATTTNESVRTVSMRIPAAIANELDAFTADERAFSIRPIGGDSQSFRPGCLFLVDGKYSIGNPRIPNSWFRIFPKWSEMTPTENMNAVVRNYLTSHNGTQAGV